MGHKLTKNIRTEKEKNESRKTHEIRAQALSSETGMSLKIKNNKSYCEKRSISNLPLVFSHAKNVCSKL